jgi:hypothetical protein
MSVGVLGKHEPQISRYFCIARIDAGRKNRNSSQNLLEKDGPLQTYKRTVLSSIT